MSEDFTCTSQKIFPLLSVCLVVPGGNKSEMGYKIGHMDKVAFAAGMDYIMRHIKYDMKGASATCPVTL